MRHAFDLGLAGESLETPVPGSPGTAPGIPRFSGLRPVTLNRFEFDRDSVKPEHQAILEAVARRIASSQATTQPIRSVRIVGHTDPSGPAWHNLQLGQRRAQQVARVLRVALERQTRGLSARVALRVESRGETEPVSTVDDALNRRVEIFLPGRLGPVPQSSQVIRKRSSALTVDERARYIRVISTLNNAPNLPNAYGRLVGVHADASFQMHGMTATGVQRFLPWHRRYLIELERMMRAIDPLAFIPYWDWTTEREFPGWLRSFTPTVVSSGSGGTIRVTRNPGSGTALPGAEVAQILTARTYTEFTQRLEDGPHNSVHVWVGGRDPRTGRLGTMASIPTAPADPVFWLHHAQVDRLWSQWQLTHRGQGPTLTGATRILTPWRESVDQVASAAALGYMYGP